MNNNGTRVIIFGRLSYANLFKPKATVQGGEEKYSTTILIDKKDRDLKARIDAAIKAAEELGVKDKWNGVKPPQIANPIWDGDGVKQDGTPFGEECKGHWVMTASAKVDYPPQVVDARVQPIMDQSQVYSGIYANVSVNFFPYIFTNNTNNYLGVEEL